MGVGDELMVTGHAREMQLKDPRKVRVVYERGQWSEIFENNPRIARPGEIGDFQDYHPRVAGLRPYCAAKTEQRWTWKEYQPPVGELYFTLRELHYAASHPAAGVILEPTVKHKASPNKNWGWENWQALADMIKGHRINITQVGPQETKVLRGASLIFTPTFRIAAAVLARARAAVLPEGGLHHAAAALRIPAVVLFGGYISPQQTGYETHRNIFTGGTPCGMRVPCKHCADAMAKITPELVMDELRRLL